MRYSQIKIRIEALILKDTQKIRGYKLSSYNYNSKKYNRYIGRIRNSIERKKKALKYVDDTHLKNYDWYEICKYFGFVKYRR